MRQSIIWEWKESKSKRADSINGKSVSDWKEALKSFQDAKDRILTADAEMLERQYGFGDDFVYLYKTMKGHYVIHHHCESNGFAVLMVGNSESEGQEVFDSIAASIE